MERAQRAFLRDGNSLHPFPKPVKTHPSVTIVPSRVYDTWLGFPTRLQALVKELVSLRLPRLEEDEPSRDHDQGDGASPQTGHGTPA